MGTTASALHLLRRVDQRDLLATKIVKAVEALGYRLVKRPGQPAEKRIVLRGDERNRYVSIYDSDNALLDTGELAQLAAALTQKLKAAAVTTSIYDGERYAFAVYHKGECIETVTGNDDPASAKRRRALFRRTFHDVRTNGGFAGFSGSHPQIAIREAAFSRAFEQATQGDMLAEDALAAWCAAAGMEPSTAFMRADDFPTVAPPMIELRFVRDASRRVDGATIAAANPEAAILRMFQDDDDTPYHRFFPAAWPTPVGSRERFTWTVESAGAGYAGLTLSLAIEGSSVPRVTTIALSASPFHAGQLMGEPVAQWRGEITFAATAAGLGGTMQIPSFAVPATRAGSRGRYLVILSLDVRTDAPGEFTLRPTLQPDGSDAFPLRPLRVVALASKHRVFLPRLAPAVGQLMSFWQQEGAMGPDPARAELRQRTPSVVASVAILPSLPEGRERACAFAQAWVGTLTPMQGLVATLHTEKHMTALGNVTRNDHEVALAGLGQDKRWQRAFDPDARLQTIRLDIAPKPGELPVAGILVQESLETADRNDAALHLGAWCVDHPEVRAMLGFTPESAAAAFDAWCAGGALLQAAVVHAAWIPNFVGSEHHVVTLVEERGEVEGRGIARVAYSTQRLRFVGPLLWLGSDLARRVDRGAIERVALVSRHGDSLRIALRSPGTLDALERALGAVMPG
ncbi:MAG: hypothetical protein IT516_04280 [Burkholderiales bacterium]|nr:hypothetical protein [Burkholderiales bacterium]